MASLNRKLEPVHTPDKGIVDVCVSFLANGTSTPASSGYLGDLLSSVAWSATGKWTITLTDGAYACHGAWASVQVGGTDKDATAYPSTIDLSAKTVIVYARNAGSASNLDTDDRVCVFLRLKKTQVTTRRS
jgi:hypothetical protein